MKHYRYAGNAMTVFCAVMTVVFFSIPLAAILFVLISKVCYETIIISAFLVIFEVIIVLYSRSVNIMGQLYTWYSFEEEYVIVYTLFQKKYVIDYASCNDIGIGYYIHGILNSGIGSKEVFIYLSQDTIDKKYKRRMNMLMPDKKCVKIGFRPDTYQFLLRMMPSKQATMLEKSYENCTIK